MAVGSAFELETQLILAIDLDYIKAEAIEDIMSEFSTLQKQIHHLIKILRDNWKSIISLVVMSEANAKAKANANAIVWQLKLQNSQQAPIITSKWTYSSP